MTTHYAGLRGPLYAWELALSAIPGVNFTAPKEMTVTVIRPDSSTVVWSSGDAGITFPTATPSALVARHVFAEDGSDVPFIPLNGNTKTCHYAFDIALTVDGATVSVPRVCAQLRNLEAC